MEITSPMYKRSLFAEKLLGTSCGNCDEVLYGEIKVCPNCGREGDLEVIKLPWEGIVYSSSTIRTAAQKGFGDELPYTAGIVKLTNGVKVPALFDSEEMMKTGEPVKARVGKIQKTSKGLIIYRPVWERKREYLKPKPKLKRVERDSLDLKEIGIEGYGIDIPRYRITGEEISRVWGKPSVKSLKSFPGKWDDPGSYAMNATLSALKHAGVSGQKIGQVVVGSESHPYAVNPTASIVAGLIEASEGAVDTEFACKAATEGKKSVFGMIEAGYIDHGLVIGTDSAQAEPNDALEYFAGDGAVAFVLGKDKPIARLEGRPVSFTTDTPDFWRNIGEEFPRHSERFTGLPGYFAHIIPVAERIMKELDLKPSDYDYFVAHQPNMKYPRKVGEMLGFKPEQIEPGIVVDFVGNLYSASSPLGLVKVLDEASPGERILIIAYGAGAGTDGFSYVTTEHIDEKRDNIERSVKSWMGEEDKEFLELRDYAIYARFKGLLKRND